MSNGDAMASALTIGKLAKAVGVNIQTVRYYERRRLLSPMDRRPSGYRLYGPTESARLRFIKNAQTLGFTLHEIDELLNLRLSSTAQCGDVLRKAQVKIVQVDTKIQALQAMAHSLRRLMRACCEGLPTDRCPILECLEQEQKVNASERRASAHRHRSSVTERRTARR